MLRYRNGIDDLSVWRLCATGDNLPRADINIDDCDTSDESNRKMTMRIISVCVLVSHYGFWKEPSVRITV